MSNTKKLLYTNLGFDKVETPTEKFTVISVIINSKSYFVKTKVFAGDLAGRQIEYNSDSSIYTLKYLETPLVYTHTYNEKTEKRTVYLELVKNIEEGTAEDAKAVL